MQVDFYHLVGSGVEQVLPRIAERVLEEKGRLLIVADDEPLAARLDSYLWSYRPESFLPHARAGKGDDARQPVLIASTCEAGNGARNIALADGLWRDEALAFDRTFLLFGTDRIEGAREAWRALGEREGLERRYWKQDDAGKWARER